MLAQQFQAFGRREAGDGGALRVDAQAGLALLVGGNPDVADDLAHLSCPSLAMDKYYTFILPVAKDNTQDRHRGHAGSHKQIRPQ